MKALVSVSLLLASVLGAGQLLPRQPVFSEHSIVPAWGDRPELLSPGMSVSIYGSNLSGAGLPQCAAQPPYPTELCETRVTVAGLDAPLLYVSEAQINFQVPDRAPTEGRVEIRVIHSSGSSKAVLVPFGKQRAVLSLEAAAYTGMPVWLHVDLTFSRRGGLRYPFSFVPWDFHEHEVGVRFKGEAVPRIALPEQAGSLQPPRWGFLGLPREPGKKQRLPLHLHYRFDKPGVYEVRYTAHRTTSPHVREIVDQSDWTRIEIRASAKAKQRAWLRERLASAPADAVELLAEVLPDILVSRDPKVLAAIEDYLYHSDVLVRNYALQSLGYFGKQTAEERVPRLIMRRGPVDVLAFFISSKRQVFQPRAVELVNSIVPFLGSSSPLIAAGTVQSLQFLKDYDWSRRPDVPRRMDSSVLAAAPGLLAMGDDQVARNLATYLGRVKLDQSRAILWEMVNNRQATEQAAVSIAWIGNPEDMPRLADLAKSRNQPDDGRAFAVIAYQLRDVYGERALPYLEQLLTSKHLFVRTAAARELILAGRRSGFAFLLDAIEQNRPYKNELLQLLRRHFLEAVSKSEKELLDFVRSKLASSRW